MAALSDLARRAGVVAAATGLSFLGALAGASVARAQAYPPCGGPFVVSTTLVIVGGHLTFTAKLPFGEPIVVELNLPLLPGPSPSSGTRADAPTRQDAGTAQTLTTLVPDAHGRVSGTLTIPRGTVPGPHVLTLATTHGHHVLLSSPLRVLPDASHGAQPRRPGDGLVEAAFVQAPPARQFVKPLLAAGAMTVGSGLGGWALRRTRARRGTTESSN